MLDPSKTVAPCVHLNGTSRDQLVENLSPVVQAIEYAYIALKQAAPNGRDYYIGTVTLSQALDQHRQRQTMLDNLVASFATELALIADGKQMP